MKKILALSAMGLFMTMGYAKTWEGRYGPHTDETWTWYHADSGRHNPIVVMVHGGGWRYGDKERTSVVKGKVAFFGAKGIDVVSINYPMLPENDVVGQIAAVDRAINAIKKSAPSYGADPHAVVLMGHSAGAHLVTMVSMRRQDLRGVVSLDSAVYDVESILAKPHLPLYDAAFEGVDMALVSPIKNVNKGAAPMIGVCSTQRTLACWETQKFALAFGKMTVLKVDKSHGAINADVGVDATYTDKLWRGMQGWFDKTGF